MYKQRAFSIFTLVLVFLILTTSAHASESSPWSFTTPTGKAQNTFTGYHERFQGFPSYQERFDFEIEESVSNGEFGAKIVPWFWIRDPDALGGKARKTRPYFELKEGWVEHISPSFDVRVGNQIITWGAADQINPTDNWNPRDMYDPLSAPKLPMNTLKINIHPPEISDYPIEVLFTPFFRNSRIPIHLPNSGTADIEKNASRWFMPLPSKLDTGSFIAPLYYKVDEPTYSSTWQAGARFQALRFGGWDFSTSYFNGVEKIPRMSFNRRGNANDPNLPITVTLLPSFHRTQILGFDGSGSLDALDTTFGLRFELAYNIRNNSRAESVAIQYKSDLVKDDFLFAVAGVDHTFEGKFFGSVVYINTMYAHYQRATRREVVAGRSTLSGLPNVDPFDNNFILYIENRFDPFKFSNVLFTSARNLDAVYSPTFSYQISDSLKSSLSMDYFFGRRTGFFGQFQDNSRTNFNLSYTF